MKKKAGSRMKVEISNDIFNEENPVLADILHELSPNGARIFLVADASVVSKTDSLGSKIGRYIQSRAIKLCAPPIVISSGEKIKCDDFSTVRSVCRDFLAAGISKDDVVVILGGGSLFDVAGYVASQIYGGVKCVRIPTTLSAMADGAFAQTAKINIGEFKSALSVESPCEAVLIDTHFLATLLAGVWNAGVAQMVRIALVSDLGLAKKFFSAEEGELAKDSTFVMEMLHETVELRTCKGESSFAMWCAEKLESMSAYKLPHGYAAAIAVAIMVKYSQLAGFLKDADAEKILSLFTRIGALESIMHSRHVISQTRKIVFGLEEYLRNTGGPFEVMTKIGRIETVQEIDYEKLEQAVRFFGVQ
jgi:3-dehydroquinate synthase